MLSVSLTVKLKSYVPVVVGVPEICPFELRVRPGGSVPDWNANVSCPPAPRAVIDWLYATPAAPSGSCQLLVTTRFMILILSVLLTLLAPLVTRTVHGYRFAG